MFIAMVKEFNDANFQKEVEQFKGVVLVDFWAPWCGPCKVQGPIVEDISKKYEGKAGVSIGKMNVGENPITSQEHQIMSIPTVKIFKKGTVIDQMVGLQSRDSLVHLLEKHLSKE